MKNTLLILLLCFVSQLYSQVCTTSINEKLDTTSKFQIYNLSNGSFIAMHDQDYPGYNIKNQPTNDYASLIFTGTIWMAGKVKSSGELRASASSYVNLSNNYDWYPGPLLENGETKNLICKIFDRIFTVSNSELRLAYSIIYNTDGTINKSNCNKIPDNVLIWPGKGNPHFFKKFGMEVPHLASFYDYNNDGIYNPCDGDLPSLETDECKPENSRDLINYFPNSLNFWVVNDNGGVHRLTKGNAMKVELHNYQFNVKGEDAEDITFYKFKSINRGSEDLSDVYFSMWLDPDLGCYNDDYVGTIMDNDMMFAYNADSLDGDSIKYCPGGNISLNKLPMVGVSYLKGFAKTVIENGNIKKINTGLTSGVYANACLAGVDPSTCEPRDIDLPFYNVMRGLWATGEPITIGGSGYNPGNTDTVKYAFNGNPANPFEWSMCSSQLEFGDRKINLNTGGVDLNVGESNEAIAAITYTDYVTYPCPSNKPIIAKNNIAKKIMENCFKTYVGPSAPDIL